MHSGVSHVVQNQQSQESAIREASHLGGLEIRAACTNQVVSAVGISGAVANLARPA
jgi:uncharacterized protein GlcG (DUF336 family)